MEEEVLTGFHACHHVYQRLVYVTLLAHGYHACLLCVESFWRSNMLSVYILGRDRDRQEEAGNPCEQDAPDGCIQPQYYFVITLLHVQYFFIL
jgi:hypothetical protein